MTRRIDKLLVANRGEIAVRVMRAAHELGIATVGIATAGERDHALHPRIADEACVLGPERADRMPYLDADAILGAARRTGADAIHPGYGFLAERADFAQRVLDEGLVWVGPSPEVMRAMADKDAAKERAASAGLPVVPGFACEGSGAEEITARAEALGYPVLIKAVAGGGGRGMRVVRWAEDLREALSLARAEAAGAFGDERLMVERFVARARHVEVQIVADHQGHCLHLFERECSVQRRHQKLLEESPSPGIDDATRARMYRAAVKLAAEIGYVGAGTVEFLYDIERGDFYFLEVNARIQVEHPVTELRTGIDLVAWQLIVAQGGELPLTQEEVSAIGHAIEVRLCAEDPAAGHRPGAGDVLLWRPPPGVRVDTALQRRDRVSMYYDSMVAKLIARGPDRSGAVAKLRRALAETVLLGLPSNRWFLRELLGHPAFAAGDIPTSFVADHAAELAEDAAEPEEATFLAAALWLAGDGLKRRFRSNPYRPDITVFERAGRAVHVGLEDLGSPGGFGGSAGAARAYAGFVEHDPDPMLLSPPVARPGVMVLERGPDAITIEHQTCRRRFHVARGGDTLWIQPHLGRPVALTIGTLLPEPEAAELPAGAVAAPSAAVVTDLHVQVGDRVQLDDPLVTVEAMKMLTVLRAAVAGRIAAVRAHKGQTVAAGAVLVELEQDA